MTNATKAAALVRYYFGRSTPGYMLLTQSAKTLKSDSKRIDLTRALYLQPHRLVSRYARAMQSGKIYRGGWTDQQLRAVIQRKYNTCEFASKGCMAGCLSTSGQLRYDASQRAMANRTILSIVNPGLFAEQLASEIKRHYFYADRAGMGAAVRIDATSDTGQGIKWARRFPNVQFYDYTKELARLYWDLPPNYDLTFSRSESNWRDCRALLCKGRKTAIVFRDALPLSYAGALVRDGLASDRRYDDPAGSVCGLLPLGKAKHDRSGFVLDHPFAVGVTADTPENNQWALPTN